MAATLEKKTLEVKGNNNNNNHNNNNSSEEGKDDNLVSLVG